MDKRVHHLLVHRVAGNSKDHRFWLANIQDPCIIELEMWTKREATVDVGSSPGVLHIATSSPGSSTSPPAARGSSKPPPTALGSSKLPPSVETLQSVDDLMERSCEGLEADQGGQLQELMEVFSDIFDG
ncbi:unnamed protein product [Arctogadus glacialis]